MTLSIPLTQGKVALVDDADYPELSKFRWYACKYGNTYYAQRASPRANGKQHKILMHAVILGTPKGMQTDHINGNGLDNRRENLRVVTCRGNQQNQHTPKSSKYPGVSWENRRRKWRVCIEVSRKTCHLGYYDDEEEAARRYQIACDWQLMEMEVFA
jgi:hypothetical protein